MGLFLQLGLFIAIIIIASRYATYMWGDSKHSRRKIRRLSKAEKDQSGRERAEARKAYEELVKEKLDVMKTAITMGYSERELAKLFHVEVQQVAGVIAFITHHWWLRIYVPGTTQAQSPKPNADR